jgi:hypothetical protein
VVLGPCDLFSIGSVNCACCPREANASTGRIGYRTAAPMCRLEQILCEFCMITL